MFLNVQDLAVQKIPVQRSFAAGELDLLDSALRLASPIEVDVVAELAAGDEIRVRGHLAGQMEASCDRCAEFFEVPIESDFELRYEPSGNESTGGERAISPSEAEVGFYQGAGIELADVILEQLLLMLPMRLLCAEDCKGICPDCGQNRNKAVCQCDSARTDPRWDALGKLAGT